jgi:hypothetical protein
VISSIVVFLLGINHIKLKFSGDFEKIYEKYEDIRKEIIKSKRKKEREKYRWESEGFRLPAFLKEFLRTFSSSSSCTTPRLTS